MSADPEGLRRIGVAVAVWAGMAAERERATGVIALSLGAARCDSARAQRMHRTALDLAAELHAERAARRKWELRLKARSLHKLSSVKARLARCTDLDRLLYREANRATVVDGPRLQLGHWLNIAGPRGVLP